MKPAAERRRAELARIHIGKAELGLDDATYRDMLWTVARVRTAAELDSHGRRKVLEHLRSRGAFRRRRYPGKPGNMTAQHRKIEALLAEAGRPWSYADAIAQRMFGIERVAWVRSSEQLTAIIAALVKNQARSA